MPDPLPPEAPPLAKHQKVLEEAAEFVKKATASLAEIRAAYFVRVLFAAAIVAFGLYLVADLFTAVTSTLAPKGESGEDIGGLALLSRAIMTATALGILYIVVRAADRITLPFDERIKLEQADAKQESLPKRELTAYTELIRDVVREVLRAVGAGKSGRSGSRPDGDD